MQYRGLWSTCSSMNAAARTDDGQTGRVAAPHGVEDDALPSVGIHEEKGEPRQGQALSIGRGSTYWREASLESSCFCSASDPANRCQIGAVGTEADRCIRTFLMDKQDMRTNDDGKSLTIAVGPVLSRPGIKALRMNTPRQTARVRHEFRVPGRGSSAAARLPSLLLPCSGRALWHARTSRAKRCRKRVQQVAETATAPPRYEMAGAVVLVQGKLGWRAS
ncbi:hypothetical protein IWX48DRAFT_590323 [Phyllosticta citricarpa]